ncbi:MAG TPA: hypothetical protein VFR27_16885 [Mycobacterium sp.]|nr:hypothetical protein [Mycobacterium sp.]
MRFFGLDKLKKLGREAERGWPGYLFGGHLRTSTLVLIVAFGAVWWVYDTNKHATQSGPTQVPASQVVPPGFVPDPNYTWVPRTRLQQAPVTVTQTVTPTPTTTETTAPPSPPPPEPPPPLLPFPLPPPFGPAPPPEPAPPLPGPPPAPPPP